VTGRWRLVLLGLGIAGVLLPVVQTSVAHACGGFFRARTIPPEQRPSLAREKVLILYDAEQRKQHFVRELAFRRADDRFGFVVPTPTRPEVERVEETPFTTLRERFPFRLSQLGMIGRGAGGGSGAGFGKSAGVEVLEVKKIGSFTVSILAATDAKALAQWLADNELVSSPEADVWLAHYVAMGFFYTAIRYDPTGKTSDTIEAETMRISFPTPIPYYPYLEPEVPQSDASGARLLELWYVGSDPVVPVALQTRGEERRWIRPLQDGNETLDAREALEAALPPDLRSLLPKGTLVVQTFQDQKTRRSGFQDILFAHQHPHELDEEALADLEPLLGILDPALATEAEP
jgi:hypothetical protein